MNKARFLMIFPLVASAVISGCTGKSNSPTAIAPPTAKGTLAASADLTPTSMPQGCALPSVFKADALTQSIGLSDLSKMNGTFKLSSINLYSQTLDPKGAMLTAFSIKASIKVGENGVRDTKLQTLCAQGLAGHGYSETLPVVMTLHLPSTRVTEFDTSDAHDLPASNNPTIASLISDAQGKVRLKNAFAAKGPYSAGLTLTDWMSSLPAQPSMTLLADGSIEMRIHWSEKNNSKVSNDGYLAFTKIR